MTNFERIRNYYKNFDEKNRLKNNASGRLEFLMTMSVLEKHLPSPGGTSAEIERLFADNGFEKELLRSVRGFGYQKEEQLFKIADAQIFDKIIELIDSTAEDKAIVETCGHAIYVGHKTY